MRAHETVHLHVVGTGDRLIRGAGGEYGGSEAVEDRAEKTSSVLSEDNESLNAPIAPLSCARAEMVVTVLVCARVICAWRGAFSAATSFVTRPATSSPDPMP